MSQGVENTELQIIPEAVFELTGLSPANHISKSTYLGLEYTYPKSPEASIFLDDIFWLSLLFLIVPIITYAAYAWGKWRGRKENPKEKAINIFAKCEKNDDSFRDDVSTNSHDSAHDVSPTKRLQNRDGVVTDENTDSQLPKYNKKIHKGESFGSEIPFPNLNLNQDGSISNSPADPYTMRSLTDTAEKRGKEVCSTVAQVYLEPVLSLHGQKVYRLQESKSKPEDPEINQKFFEEKLPINKENLIIKEEEGKMEVQILAQPDGSLKKIERTEVTTVYVHQNQFPMLTYSNDQKSICESSEKSGSENSMPITIFSHMDSNERKAQSKTPSIPTHANIDRSSSLALVAVTRTMSDTTGQSSNLITQSARFSRNQLIKPEENHIVEVEEILEKISHQPAKKSNSEKLDKSVASITKSTRADSKSKPEDEKSLHLQRLELEYDLPHETGKFERIFKCPESIGAGSFGEVFKVVHRVDGKLYAVKKVKLNFGRIEDLQMESKVFREVFAMTDLHHPNIVRYSTCWVEVDYKIPEDKTRRAQSLEDISESSESDPSYSEDNDEREATENYDMIQFADSKASESQIVFERSQAESKQEMSKSKNFKRRNEKKHSSKILKTLTKSIKEDDEDSNASQSQSIMSNYSNMSKIDPRFKHCRLYLYIQMEFCSGSSLRTYLDNPKREVSIPTVLEMFHKLLEGVRMIHSHNILHRDLKPANIFLDEHNNVKIGDFGLASLSNFEDGISENNKGLNLFTNNKKSGLNRSMRVGTPLYTSPEQERGGSYDNKTDIYSLGLIFCEMLCVFGTTHERYQILTGLREKHELPEKIFARFDKYSEGLKDIILKMTQKAPADRPTAEIVLKEVENLREKRS